MSAPDTETRPDDTLGVRVSRGLGWSLLGQVVSRLGVFATGVVLARLLDPIDFGEVAAALVIVNVVLAINELGVIPAIVRWNGDPTEAAGTAATIALVNSGLVYAASFVIAPYVASITNTPGSVWVIRIMALSVLVDGVIAVPLAMLNREIRTVPQVIAEVSGMAVYALGAVGLAGVGIGAHALAWGRVAGAVATGLVMIGYSRWPSRLRFDRAVASQLLRYGAPLAISQGVLEAVMTIDYLVVGRQLSGAALGVYLLAFNLSSWPVTIVSTAVARVSFAGFSALLHDRDRLAAGFTHSIAVAASATVGMVVVLVATAPELVDVVYGSTWRGAVSPLRWLLLLGGLRVLLQLVGEIVAVVGHTRWVLRTRVLWLLALPLALGFGADRWGLGGVGAAHVVVAVVLVLPLFVRDLRRSQLPTGALLAVFARPAAAAAAAGVAMLVFSPLIEGALLRLVVLGGIVAATYGLVLLPANPTVRRTWVQLRGAEVGA